MALSVCWAGVLLGMRDEPGKGQRVPAICRPVPGATRLRRPPNVSNRKKRKDERQQLAWDLILPARHNVSCDKRQRLKVRKGLLLLLLMLLLLFFFFFFSHSCSCSASSSSSSFFCVWAMDGTTRRGNKQNETKQAPSNNTNQRLFRPNTSPHLGSERRWVEEEEGV